MYENLPRILIVDDLFGRCLPNGMNEDRDNLCASFLLQDVTNEWQGKRATPRQKIKSPIAEAVFIRGQTPVCASNGEVVANDLEGTLRFIRDGWYGSGLRQKRWSLVLLDLCFYTGKVTGKLHSSVSGLSGVNAELGMPEGNADDIVPSQFFGIKLLKAIHIAFPDLPVVILSSQERDKVSQQYSASGAMAFLCRTSPNGEELLRTYLDRHGLMPEPYGAIVGCSLPLLKALRAARRTAYNDQRENILIRGERGVGKDEFARFIHRAHPMRASMSLIAVNSAVLTSELFQSELFGIEKGRATGVSRHDGAAFRANGGDLFFDEIKDMIPRAQAGILRFLEDGGFTPTGSEKLIESDVRVISATNADLEALAASGHFRDDLLDRLKRGGSLVLPPLRERKDDIPLLAQAFVRQAEATKKSEGFHRQFSEEALLCLANDDWPGNIRVLRDVLQKVVKDNDVEHIYPAQIEKAKKDLGIDQSPIIQVSIPALPPTPVPEVVPHIVATVRTTVVSRAPLPLVIPAPPASSVVDATIEQGGQAHFPKQPESLAELIATINSFKFDLSNPDVLYNQLGTIDEAAAKLVVGYILASLLITKDHTSGEPEITRAMQFVRGTKKLKTSTAYDMIKRLMKRNAGVLESALNEPLLKKALEQAKTNRPTNPRKRKDSNSDD
jgi:DNA-binding NtrC family response regulator